MSEEKEPKKKKGRGFASMSKERRRQIASQGGKAAHEKGTAHRYDSDEASEAGRKGGQSVSRDREHMRKIGRRGGLSVHGKLPKKKAEDGKE